MQIKKLSKKQKADERRKHLRVSRNLAIKLEDKEADFVTETKNISCLGAYCQVDAYLPILSKLKVTLLIPKASGAKNARHITCEGTVVRVERSKDPLESNKYDIAVYFNQISKSDMRFIDSYVKSNIAQSV